jgi:hypothetical protein
MVAAQPRNGDLTAVGDRRRWGYASRKEFSFASLDPTKADMRALASTCLFSAESSHAPRREPGLDIINRLIDYQSTG